MKRYDFILAIAAGLTCVNMVSASAAVLTYTYDSGAEFTFSDGGVADLTGTFTISPPTDSLSATDDIVVTGGQEAGTYTPYKNNSGLIYFKDSSFDYLTLTFSPDINSAPGHPLLSGVNWDASSGASSDADSLTGGATLNGVPEPSTWSMMLFGFAALAFASYRVQRKQAGVAA